MSNYTRNSLTGDLAPVNAELQKVQQSISEKLDRSPSVGQANQLENTLDANSNRIINLPAPAHPNDPARLADVSAGQGTSVLPVQTGQANKYLRTDGVTPYWDGILKATVGLGNVDNTSDSNKPVSSAQQTALNLKLNVEGITTTDLINSTTTYSVDTIVNTTGFTASGDAGNAPWKQNGVTGQTISQTPSQLGNALLNDGNGNQWSFIPIYGTLSLEINSAALGASGNGITSSYSPIAAAVAYLKSNGGGCLILPSGVVITDYELLIDSSNITVAGAGSDISHDVGASQGVLAGTELKWAGSAGGTILRFTSPEGASLPKQSGGGASGIFFRGVNAARGLVVESQDKGLFEKLHFNEFSSACIELNTVTTLGDAADPQKNVFSQITCRQEVSLGDFVRLDGLTNVANTSNNTFYQLSATINNGDAYKLNNCDNNTFVRCGVFRIGGGTGNAIVCNGSDTSLGSVARTNLFIHFSSNNTPIVAKGTSSFVHASHDNKIVFADTDNGTPNPTIETGATFWFDTAENVFFDTAISQAAIGDTGISSKTARNNLTTESVRIKNGANNHAVLESADGLSSWSFNIDNSTGNARINRGLGTGKLELNQELQLTGQSSATTGLIGGAADAPPSNPVAYLNVVINGTLRKVPYYS
jgi:hypothetical protein